MKKLSLILSMTVMVLGISSFGVSAKSKQATNVDGPEFAKPGMVAYAASYSSNATDEPKYSTQNNKTFQYLGLGNTLNFYRGDSVKVGIIDSGINYDHEDFMVNSQTKVKGDSKYYSYATSSWVYYKASQHGYSYIDDSLGHGTNVAATVAAAVNDVGGLGLAPNVELYVYKVTNSSNGYEFGAIQNALSDAVTLGLDVINMSFQSYEHAVSYGTSSMGASSGCSTILSYYLNQAYNAGITLVGAAGNYNTDEPSYPGSNNHVINVGSLNQTGTDKAGFSNYGSTIDLVAPGYVHVADKGNNNAYKDTSGTSFSAPLVTASIALYKQQNPSATPSQIESALYAACDPIDDSGSAYTNWAGHGALNVAKFLNIDQDGPTDIVVNNPEIQNDELTLEVGHTFDLDLTVNGQGTFSSDVEFELYNDDGIISVDSNGRITALKEGEEILSIVSTQNPLVSVDIYITVTPTPTLTLSPSSVTLEVGQTQQLTAATYPSATITYTSSDSTVATVSNSGLITAKKAGSATISASANNLTKECLVTVTAPVTLSSIFINGQTTSFIEGDAFSFGGAVTAHFSDSTSSNVTASASFSGYNMTSTGQQTVTVSYTYKGTTKTTTYTITVGLGTLSSIAVSGQTTIYQKDASFSFNGKCTATFANGYQKEVTPTEVTLPNMNICGVKTITVSYTYNGKTVSTTYDITVLRTVIEQTSSTGYSVVGTITYPSNTQTISSNTLSVSTSGYTAIESNSVRLGSGSNTGSVTVTSTSSNITKVVASIKTYGSDTGVTITIDGTSNTITSSYADYSKEFVVATNSVTIATTTNKKRAYVQSITIYETKTTTINTDISNTDDCVGLETFISTYMHMDYTDNLGYCKDTEHHYYETAKVAFNVLNDHQRSLFTGNTAYSAEWERLRTWASINGDHLDSNNKLVNTANMINPISNNGNEVIIVVMIITILLIPFGLYLFRRKEQ